MPVAAQQQPTEYTLKITPQELELLAKALGSQPYNDVAVFMNKIRQQVIDQQNTKKIEPQSK